MRERDNRERKGGRERKETESEKNSSEKRTEGRKERGRKGDRERGREGGAEGPVAESEIGVIKCPLWRHTNESCFIQTLTDHSLFHALRERARASERAREQERCTWGKIL